MFLALAVGIPILLVFGGALLALAFSAPSTGGTQGDRPRRTVEEQPPSFFILPSSLQRTEGRELAHEDLVFRIEAHLLKETQAAERFARSPSQSTLWLDHVNLN